MVRGSQAFHLFSSYRMTAFKHLSRGWNQIDVKFKAELRWTAHQAEARGKKSQI